MTEQSTGVNQTVQTVVPVSASVFIHLAVSICMRGLFFCFYANAGVCALVCRVCACVSVWYVWECACVRVRACVYV